MQYKLIEGLINLSKCQEMTARMDAMASRMVPDTQSPMSLSFPGIFNRIQKDLTPIIAREFKVDLVPTYNYGRKYYPGDELKRHMDRPSCEYSITVNLAQEDTIWPFYVETKTETKEFELNVGDAVAYKGCEVYHWREELTSGICHQHFFHWVGTNGQYKEHAFDKKKSNFIKKMNKDELTL